MVSVRLGSTEWRVNRVILNLGGDQMEARNFCMRCFCGLSSASCPTDLAVWQRFEGARTAAEAFSVSANYLPWIAGWLAAHD